MEKSSRTLYRKTNASMFRGLHSILILFSFEAHAQLHGQVDTKKEVVPSFAGEKVQIFFSDFPAVFQNQKTVLFISPSLRYYTDTILNVLNLQKKIKKIYVTNASIKPEENVDVIALLDYKDIFIKNFKKSVFEYENDFAISSQDNRIKHFNRDSLKSTGTAQIFLENRHYALVMTASNQISPTTVIKAFSEQLTSLNANLCIAGKTYRYLFDTQSERGKIIYKRKGKIFNFLKAHEYFFQSVSLILLLLTFITVNRKLKQSQSMLYENS